MRIELLWFEGCPNHEAARIAVEEVLMSRGLDASILTPIRVDADHAAELRFPGSPTIRVNGRDVEPRFEEADEYSLCCRVYATAQGLRGEPERAWIERAIDDAMLRG